MRTPRRAAWAAAVFLAGGSLLSVTTSATADHLRYVPPTEYEAELAAAHAAEADAQAADPAVVEAPAEYSQSASSIPGGLAEALAALRMCESSDDYAANTGNGYYGAYQFSLSTWNWLGYSGYPHHAPPWVQDEAAVALYNIYGWSPWPACSAYLGLA
jgi:hypothetical protein